MSATRILWGQMLLVSLVAFLFIWAATQWTAWQLGFLAQFGEPMFNVLALRLYNPLIFFYWWDARFMATDRAFVRGRGKG